MLYSYPLFKSHVVIIVSMLFTIYGEITTKHSSIYCSTHFKRSQLSCVEKLKLQHLINHWSSL